ncbi:MAG: aminotransferase class III-fold pyridoxal phosphate-dependent enzyme [Planctomycetota bacterium]
MVDDLITRDLAVLWHPCSQMRDYESFPPVEVIGADGCHVQLADGRRVIDAISSWWCKSLGHGHPHLRQALHDQVDGFDQVIQANTTNRTVVRMCERLLSAANGYPSARWGAGAGPGREPGWFGKVFLADNGSTAVEIALKMALQAQRQAGRIGRTRFAALVDGYHGETVATLSVGDCGLYGDPFRSMLFDVPKLGPLPRRRGPTDPDWLDAGDAWPAIERQLASQADQLAAIVYEPVLQGAGGMQLYSPDLLRRLRAWADAHDVYLIADEIAAGMGRVGGILASHLAAPAGPWYDHAGCLPDFAVLSKGLTGGMLPLSAVLTTDVIYEHFLGDYFDFTAFLHSNTYTGNPLGVAVADAALDVYAGEGVLAQVAERGAYMGAALQSLASDRADLHGWRACGMLAAVDIRRPDGSRLPREARIGYRVFQEALRRGAWLRPLGDTSYLMPPLTCDERIIDEMIAILADSLDAVLGG